MRNLPPKVLIKTWYQLLKQNDDKEAKQRAAEMLLSVFGTMDDFAKYIEQNDL